MVYSATALRGCFSASPQAVLMGPEALALTWREARDNGPRELWSGSSASMAEKLQQEAPTSMITTNARRPCIAP